MKSLEDRIIECQKQNQIDDNQKVTWKELKRFARIIDHDLFELGMEMSRIRFGGRSMFLGDETSTTADPNKETK